MISPIKWQNMFYRRVLRNLLSHAVRPLQSCETSVLVKQHWFSNYDELPLLISAYKLYLELACKIINENGSWTTFYTEPTVILMESLSAVGSMDLTSPPHETSLSINKYDYSLASIIPWEHDIWIQETWCTLCNYILKWICLTFIFKLFQSLLLLYKICFDNMQFKVLKQF